MKKLLLVLTLLLICGANTFSQSAVNPPVSADWLKKHLSDDDLVLFHVGTEEHYREEHIPGARFLAPGDVVVDSKDGSREYELPPVEAFVSLLEEHGVDDGDRIVLYVGSNWVAPMTRIYFTLEYLGYGRNTFVLDGGLPLWKHLGGEVTTEIPDVERGSFRVTPNADLITSMDEVRDNLRDSEFQLVDARAPAFYQGVQESGGMKGHIPGARSLPYSSLFREGPNGSYLFLSSSEMQALFDERNLSKEDPLVLYCHIGQQATVVYYASRLLGYQPVLYDGSFYEWGRDDTNPIEEN